MTIHNNFFICILLTIIATTSSHSQNCGDPNTLCVDDQAGTNREYSTLQAAADAAKPGDTVFVFDGNYTGFEVENSGTPTARITFKAQSDKVIITSPCPTGDGIRLNGVSDITIDGFKILKSNDKDIAARDATADKPMARLIIRNNICLDAAEESIYLSQVGNSVIENNTIVGKSTSTFYRNHGIYLANAGSDNTTIRGNNISKINGSEGNGIHINGDLSVGGDGIISGLIIENNILWNNGQNGLNLDGVQNSLIQNNLIYGNIRHAVRAYKVDGAQGPKNLKFINNTLIVPSSSEGWPIKLSDDVGGNTIFNNILLSEGSSKGGFVVGNSNFISNYNIVSGNFSLDEESNILNLTKWRVLGYDSTSVTATPAELFVNPSNNDYHLKQNAVKAICKGISVLNKVEAPSYDLESKTRLQIKTPEIGAFQYADKVGLAPFSPSRNHFSRFPDRTINGLQIEALKNQPFTLNISDISGKRIASIDAASSQKDIRISNGMYIVQIKSGRQVIPKNMVIYH